MQTRAASEMVDTEAPDMSQHRSLPKPQLVMLPASATLVHSFLLFRPGLRLLLLLLLLVLLRRRLLLLCLHACSSYSVAPGRLPIRLSLTECTHFVAISRTRWTPYREGFLGMFRYYV